MRIEDASLWISVSDAGARAGNRRARMESSGIRSTLAPRSSPMIDEKYTLDAAELRGSRNRRSAPRPFGRLAVSRVYPRQRSRRSRSMNSVYPCFRQKDRATWFFTETFTSA